MNVKHTARRQYRRLVDRAANQVASLPQPAEGWIVSVRNALGMSVVQLAQRAGVTRAAIYQAQRNEEARAITLRQMEKLAEAMGAQFVFAIVPKGHVDEVIAAQATRKAEALVARASAHMALEEQSLSARQNQQEVRRLAKELAETLPADLWDDGEGE